MSKSCPFAEQVHRFGEELQSAFPAAIALLPAGNPLGLVVVVYCRECDCTHASLFEPDGPPGSSVLRAAHALRVASTRVRIESGGTENGKTVNSKNDETSN